MVKVILAYCCLTDMMEHKSKKVVVQQITTVSEQSSTASLSHAQSQPQPPPQAQPTDGIGLQALVRRRSNISS